MSPTRGQKPSGKGRIKGAVELVGLGPDQAPEVRLNVVDLEGTRQPLPMGPGHEFELDEALVGTDLSVEVTGASGVVVRRLGFDTLARKLRADGVLQLLEPAWHELIVNTTCVTGSVQVCRPWHRPWLSELSEVVSLADIVRLGPLVELQPSALAVDAVDHASRVSCSMVCRGKVEVFVRTCCCPPIGPIDPPIVIRNICEIINCDLIEVPHEIGPGPGPGPDPAPDVAILRALKLADATEGAASVSEVVELGRHLKALTALPLAQQVAYLEVTPALAYLRCSCSTTKVAEVPIQEDGHFDACFHLPRLHHGCSRRVQYRVWQIQESGWVLIYDGLGRHQSFDLGVPAQLYALQTAHSCPDPHEWGPTPFVILERIGNTWADTLIHSTDQAGENAAGVPTFAGPLAATDGLANEAPAGPHPVTAGPYDQPWGATLNLGYQFHPGLHALGARYFRTRVVRVGAGGQPVGGPAAVSFVLTGDLSWRKYYDPPGPDDVGVRWVPLQNPVINGHEGLYTIPFPDLAYPWLEGQWHARVDTTELTASGPRTPNGRYLFIVDVFDAAGQRLVPNGSLEPAGPGELARAFQYRRLDGPIDAAFSSTSVVPHRALANLFRVDNLAAYADIEKIVHNAVASDANCQFLTGPETDTVQLQYSAYQANGFQWYHQLALKQGLTGPVTHYPASSADVYSGLTPVKTFGGPASSDPLLPGPDRACAFAATLDVYTRHTNGIGLLSGYWREDVAAFAISITP